MPSNKIPVSVARRPRVRMRGERAGAAELLDAHAGHEPDGFGEGELFAAGEFAGVDDIHGLAGFDGGLGGDDGGDENARGEALDVELEVRRRDGGIDVDGDGAGLVEAFGAGFQEIDSRGDLVKAVGALEVGLSGALPGVVAAIEANGGLGNGGGGWVQDAAGESVGRSLFREQGKGCEECQCENAGHALLPRELIKLPEGFPARWQVFGLVSLLEGDRGA